MWSFCLVLRYWVFSLSTIPTSCLVTLIKTFLIQTASTSELSVLPWCLKLDAVIIVMYSSVCHSGSLQSHHAWCSSWHQRLHFLFGFIGDVAKLTPFRDSVLDLRLMSSLITFLIFSGFILIDFMIFFIFLSFLFFPSLASSPTEQSLALKSAD